MIQLPIPSGPEVLTCEWLTGALRETEAVARATVAAFVTEPVGEEWGFTGKLARVSLEYDVQEEGAPASLVAKFPNPSAKSRLDADRLRQRYRRFEREVLFYRHLGRSAAIRTPRFYYGAADVDAGEFVLLLEDLAPGRVGDALLGCSAAEAALVVDRIAAFHATILESLFLERGYYSVASVQPSQALLWGTSRFMRPWSILPASSRISDARPDRLPPVQRCPKGEWIVFSLVPGGQRGPL